MMKLAKRITLTMDVSYQPVKTDTPTRRVPPDLAGESRVPK